MRLSIFMVRRGRDPAGSPAYFDLEDPRVLARLEDYDRGLCPLTRDVVDFVLAACFIAHDRSASPVLDGPSSPA